MIKKSLLVVLGIAVVGLGGYGIYYWSKLPKSGWKTIKGCVASSGKNIDYQFYGKSDWYSVTPDMGCGKKYEDAESWGLKNKDIGTEKTDVALITVLIQSTKPAEYDGNSFAYFSMPEMEDVYSELGRITANIGTEILGITNDEWQYIKNSFRFKK